MQTNRSSPQRRAAELATRDRAVMQEIQKEQQARDKKTARLRALRLAKEAADKETAERAKAERLLAAQKALKLSSSGKISQHRVRKPQVEPDDSKARQAHG